SLSLSLSLTLTLSLSLWVFMLVRLWLTSIPDDPPLCVSDSNRMFTWESLKAVWHGQKLDYFKEAHLGSRAPNPEVVQLDQQQKGRLLDYARERRPLILNFGSCT
uniref:Iodothyronine deiodinase n=1 Tax=Erpetoichthys calabaricus TaxID=27687 RepID=A0A8C4TAS7_ERPCA